MERDAAQLELGPQPLPVGNVRPRARPLKRAKSQAHVIADPPQLQSTDQIEQATSGAAGVGVVEYVHALPPTQEIENDDSHEDTSRLLHKTPDLTLHQLNHADKRQKISDQVQSEVAETMNRSAEVDAAAKGNYILMAFQRLATQTY